MPSLKTVSRNEYIAALKAARDTVSTHVVEGYSCSIVQYQSTQDERVRFQAMYANVGSTAEYGATYYIEDVA